MDHRHWAPGPDRGEGGKYLIVPPGYEGPLPDSGFFVGRSKTRTSSMPCARSWKTTIRKPAVATIKKG
jgi:hypothetical protein